MNPLTAICLLACLLAVAAANPMNSGEWENDYDLKKLPSLKDVTFERLSNMPLEEGARLVDTIYHLSKLNKNRKPTYKPRADEITVSIYKPNEPKVMTTLDKLPSKAKQIDNFGTQQVTVLITGLPKELKPVQKAIHYFINAQMARDALEQQQIVLKPTEDRSYSGEHYGHTNQWRATSLKTSENSGTLVVIELGEKIQSFKDMYNLKIVETGKEIGKMLRDLTKEKVVRGDDITLIGHGIGAHVAGAAGREYSACTGKKLRYIVGLDAGKVYNDDPKVLTSLARGDAKFVQGIHTSSYGLGTAQRVGKVDFFVDGLTHGVHGARNVFDASARAIRIYAETVIPGNEKNFPAVAANSLKQFENNNGYGKRTFMGIATENDIEGDYMLKINESAPYGRSIPIQKQNGYHGKHSASWMNRDEEY